MREMLSTLVVFILIVIISYVTGRFLVGWDLMPEISSLHLIFVPLGALLWWLILMLYIGLYSILFD